MKRLKKILRLSSLVLMIVLASVGIGITGAIFPNKRGEYIDNEIKTEMPKEQEEETKQAQEVLIN